jgi:hypothetical protein
MPYRTSPTGSELFIVDNSGADRKILRSLREVEAGCRCHPHVGAYGREE